MEKLIKYNKRQKLSKKNNLFGYSHITIKSTIQHDHLGFKGN